jgi:hypothetical protein
MLNIKFACNRKTPLPTLDTSYYDEDMARRWVKVPNKIFGRELKDVVWETDEPKPAGRLKNVDIRQMYPEKLYENMLAGDSEEVINLQRGVTAGAAYEVPKELMLHKARMMVKAGILSPERQYAKWGAFSEYTDQLKERKDWKQI